MGIWLCIAHIVILLNFLPFVSEPQQVAEHMYLDKSNKISYR